MKKLSILVFVFVFSSLSLSLSAQQVIEWRGDRTGVYTETGLLKEWNEGGPDLLWHYDGLGDGYSSVVICADKIYITGCTDEVGYIYVFDMKGNLLNKKEYGAEWTIDYDGARGTIIPNDGLLYVVNGHGELFCIDAADLSPRWKKTMRDDFGAEPPRHGTNESPLIVGEKLIFTPGGKEHNVVALNKKTGDLIWSTPAMGDVSSYCCPIYLDDQEVPQIVTMTGHHVVGLDISNGKMLWFFPFTNRFFEHPNTPVYGDSMLLCTSSYGVGSIMLRLKNGGREAEQAWSSVDLDSRTGHMVKLGDYAYGSGDYGRGSWYCVDWKTGEQLYKDRTLPTGVVIAADGMLYCYSDKGDMALVRATPEKFDLVSRFSITQGTAQHWAHPVIHNGVLYVRHGNSLMAYKIK